MFFYYVMPFLCFVYTLIQLPMRKKQANKQQQQHQKQTNTQTIKQTTTIKHTQKKQQTNKTNKVQIITNKQQR